MQRRTLKDYRSQFHFISFYPSIKILSVGEIPIFLLHLIHKLQPGKILESSAADQLLENSDS